MPKKDQDMGEYLAGSGFAKFGRMTDPESYRKPMQAVESFFKGSPKKKQGQPGMAPGTMAAYAKSQGYTMNKDGSFTKAKPQAKKQQAKPLMKGKKQNVTPKKVVKKRP